MKALIVDDDRDLGDAISQSIDDIYKVTVARSGHEALRTLESESFHVIVSDLYMPGLNGVELMKTVVEMKIPTPVIFLTGAGSVDACRELGLMGVYEYLEKPVAPRILRECLISATGLRAKIEAAGRSKEENPERVFKQCYVVDENICRDFRAACLQKGVSASTMLEKLMQDFLERKSAS